MEPVRQLQREGAPPRASLRPLARGPLPIVAALVVIALVLGPGVLARLTSPAATPSPSPSVTTTAASPGTPPPTAATATATLAPSSPTAAAPSASASATPAPAPTASAAPAATPTPAPAATPTPRPSAPSARPAADAYVADATATWTSGDLLYVEVPLVVLCANPTSPEAMAMCINGPQAQARQLARLDAHEAWIAAHPAACLADAYAADLALSAMVRSVYLTGGTATGVTHPQWSARIAAFLTALPGYVADCG